MSHQETMQRLREAASRGEDLSEALVSERAHLMECELCQMEALRLLGLILYNNESAYWEQLEDPTILREPRFYPEFSLDFLQPGAESVEMDAWRKRLPEDAASPDSLGEPQTSLDHDSVQPLHDSVRMPGAALIARCYIAINQMRKRLLEMQATLSPQETDQFNTLLKNIGAAEKEFERAGRDSEKLRRVFSDEILPMQEEIERFLQSTARPPHD